MAGALTKAGRYQIVGELGRGSMGVVYKGFDPVIGRTVAIKTMLPEGLSSQEFEEYKARFQREAMAAGILAHPNIITVYDFGEDNGVLYLAMEYLEGQSLEKIVQEQQVLPIEAILPIYDQVCSALDHAHRNMIVHRDVKPGNIMILQNGLVKMTDFGIAKMMSMGMTQAGQILGTPNYMSPEQVKGRQIDGRSDIFSLGVILYELVTGEKPFGGQNITTVIYKIINENPIPPRELDASIPAGLSYIISKALAKSVDDRYQTCRELAEDLRNYKNLDKDVIVPSVAVASTHSVPPASNAPPASVAPAGGGAENPQIRPAPPASNSPWPSNAPPASVAPAGGSAENPQIRPAPPPSSAPSGGPGESSQFRASTSPPPSGGSGEGSPSRPSPPPSTPPPAQQIETKGLGSSPALNAVPAAGTGESSQFRSGPPSSQPSAQPIEISGLMPSPQPPGPAALPDQPPRAGSKLPAPPAPAAPSRPTTLDEAPIGNSLNAAAGIGEISQLMPSPPTGPPPGSPAPKSATPQPPARKPKRATLDETPIASTFEAQAATPQAPTRESKSSMVWIVAVVLLLAVVGAGYYVMRQRQKAASSLVTESVATPSPNPPPSPQTPVPQTPVPAPVTPAPETQAPATPPPPPAPAPDANAHEHAAPAAAKGGQLAVISNVNGAHIFIDGHSDPTWITPFTIKDLSPGVHSVEISMDGYDSSQQSVTIAAGQTASLEGNLSAPRAELGIHTNPSGLEVLIDGKSYGPSPVQATLNAGQHTYAVVQPSGTPYQNTVNLKSGEIVTKTLTLSVVGSTGIVEIHTTPPGATVTADGAPVGGQTPNSCRLSVGNHTLVISLAGFKPVQQQVTVSENATATVNVSLTSQ